MENVKIERLKELVEEIADEYESIPKEILDELNEITGNGWKEEEYIEYCAEYWSSNSLDETVYALINHGQYPPCIRETIYFWNQNTDTQMSDEEISSILQKMNCLINLIFFRLKKNTNGFMII